MRYRGINYDIGTKTITGRTTLEIFDPVIIAKEIGIIRNELHCNAIRISGTDIDRIVQASELALQEGLTVWFSPSIHYDNPENTLRYIIKAAGAAEKLRQKYQNVIFVLGCELSVFTSGFIKGDTGMERMKRMFGPLGMIKNMLGIKRTYNKKLNEFLSVALKGTRPLFRGQVTYASGPWEKVDWQLFDMVSVDLYRSRFNKSIYTRQLQGYKQWDKPVCVTEFGCCTFKGAAEKGAMGWTIVDWRKEKPQLKGDYIRDEKTQAQYLLELLDIFEKENISAAFAFTFISRNYPYNLNPHFDLDMAAFGIVKIMPANGKTYYKGLSWLPKLAFFQLAEYFEKKSI